MSEPDDDMPSCSDNECRCKKERRPKAKPEAEMGSPLRKIVINGGELEESPLANLDQKMSPFKASIHEMIQNEAAFDLIDIDMLLAQIDLMQA